MYLKTRFYIVATIIILMTAAGHFVPMLFTVGKGMLGVFLLTLLADIVLLWHRRGLYASRLCSDRFSNGDDNDVRIRLESSYPFTVETEVIDEAPHIFQRRDISYAATLRPREGKTLRYTLHPVRRGVYGFGRIRVFVSTRIGLVQRRFTQGEPKDVTVYPSFLHFRQYELLAISDNLTETGAKRIRRPGNHTEFEHIQEYVPGDDFRTINWKASARRHQLMVNVYQDERSQRVYSVIDKGRVMQQAFKGMTLLDYSINAALALSFVAMRKMDNAGLITFDQHFDAFVPADHRPSHMQTLHESLYAQQTTFGETDFTALCTAVSRHVSRRSLLVLFTSFATLTAMQRQLPYLRQLAQRHCLLVVFFEDDDLRAFAATPLGRPSADDRHHQPEDQLPHRVTTEDYYQHTIAEKFEYEKRLIVSTLKQNGIYALLTSPSRLSVAVINKYLELKQRHVI
ncbi:MAG: DUF58 domain-containing protein [Prevotella sp.]|nr:DUF58 domain-containing protein [Prevotella sp.]